MKANWFISSNCFDDGNPEKMKEAAERMGCAVHYFPYVPFSFDIKPNFKFNHNDCVISYGCIQLAKVVQKHTAWIPGVWCDWDKLTCVNYLSYWGHHSIHKNYAFLPLAEILRKREEIFSKYGSNNTLFIKPDANNKAFHGEKICLEKFDEWWKYAQCYDPEPNILCLISEPVKIQREWRLIVADKQVITGSQYRGEGELQIQSGYPKEAADFAQEIASGTFEPAPIYCMDIAQTNAGMKLVEIGSINVAGLYSCDIGKIVEYANDIAVREFEEGCHE